MQFKRQVPLKVRYEGFVVGDFVADLLVERSILVELKAVNALDKSHYAQCLNYLKATDLKLCLLINFGTQKIQIKRIINS
jgi:GxxExxY protein